MGLLDFFRRKALTASPEVVEIASRGQFNTYRRLGGTNQRVEAAFVSAQSANYAYMYAHQPAVRTVVDYIARNVAQLGLKLYERVSDTEREHDSDHPAAQTMATRTTSAPPTASSATSSPTTSSTTTPTWSSSATSDAASGTWSRSPTQRRGGGQLRPLHDRELPRSTAQTGPRCDVTPADVIHWRGYNPADPRHRDLASWRRCGRSSPRRPPPRPPASSFTKSGLSKPGYIKRPLEAPEWSDEARQRFQEAWANQTKQSSRKTPVLEEGMEFADFGVTPKDAEMLDGRRVHHWRGRADLRAGALPARGRGGAQGSSTPTCSPRSPRSSAEQLDFSILLWPSTASPTTTSSWTSTRSSAATWRTASRR